MDTPAIASAIDAAQREHNASTEKAKANLAKHLRKRLGDAMWKELGITMVWDKPGPLRDVEAIARFTYHGIVYNLTMSGNWAYRQFMIMNDTDIAIPFREQPHIFEVLSSDHLSRDLALFLAQQKDV